MHWFQKWIFWKNSLSPFGGRWDQEVIFEVAEAKFWISSSFNKFSFRIFVVLGFEVVWPRWPRRPRRGVREIFQKLHFWNQCIPTKKMSYVPSLRSTFSLNLSIEEGCTIISKFACCGCYMKKNVAFTLISSAVLKWDDCLSVQVPFQLPVQIPVQLLLELEVNWLDQKCEWTRIRTI
jgi:hypothetical protein